MSAMPSTRPEFRQAPSLQILRGLMRKERLIMQDLFNYAKASLTPGTKLTYQKRTENVGHYATVVDVTGVPGRIRVIVEKATGKRLGIMLDEIAGIVRED